MTWSILVSNIRKRQEAELPEAMLRTYHARAVRLACQTLCRNRGRREKRLAQLKAANTTEVVVDDIATEPFDYTSCIEKIVPTLDRKNGIVFRDRLQGKTFGAIASTLELSTSACSQKFAAICRWLAPLLQAIRYQHVLLFELCLRRWKNYRVAQQGTYAEYITDCKKYFRDAGLKYREPHN